MQRRPGLRTVLRGAAWAAAVLLLVFALWVGLLYTGNLKAPYSALAKRIAWAGGFQETAYNFGEVVPGRVYRSAMPDERFLRYLREQYGIRRVLALNGGARATFHNGARELGIHTKHYGWSPKRVPPSSELREVLDAMETPEPTLVHCRSGKDRTGYAVAAFRIEREGWELDAAFDEMNHYWHLPQRLGWFQDDLRNRSAQQQGSTPADAPLPEPTTR